MLKTPLFYVLLLVLMGLMVGGMAISSNVSLMAQSALGISATKGAIFGTLYFIGVGVGGVVAGVLNDKLGGGKALLTLCVLSFIVVGIYLLFGQGVFFLFALVVLFVGLGYGGQGTAMAVITMNIWGEKHFGVNMGFVGVAGMISSAIGPVVAGAAEVNTTLIVILICNIVGVIAAFMFDRLSKSFVKSRFKQKKERISMITINWDKHLDFDAQVPPPGMREVIFVKGTPYEMGKQYGEKTKKMIKRNFCLVAGDALKNYTKE